MEISLNSLCSDRLPVSRHEGSKLHGYDDELVSGAKSRLPCLYPLTLKYRPLMQYDDTPRTPRQYRASVCHARYV